MTKKAYKKPVMDVVKIQQQSFICASTTTFGMSKSLQREEVDVAWSRNGRGHNE